MTKRTDRRAAPMALDRRSFLRAGAATAAAGLLPTPSRAREPALRKFHLTPKPGRIPLLPAPSPQTEIWGYDGLVPGPEIRIRQGDRVEIAVENRLAQPTTVHWHGLRIPNAMDGVPELTQPPISPGGRFTYTFAVEDAGTYWYHPHTLSSQQVAHGLYGAFVVEEADPPAVDRDVLWIIDDWRLTDSAEIHGSFASPRDRSHAGRLGNVATLNGRDSSRFALRAGERLRLRLINTANARIFGLEFGGHDPLVIALDGQPVAPHRPSGPITLGSGQRADLILDATGDPGSTHPVVDSHSKRNSYKYLDLVYSDETPLRTDFPDPPPPLAANPLPPLDLAGAQRHPVTIAGGAMGGLRRAVLKGAELPIRDLAARGKMWALNGIVADGMKMAPLLTLARDRSHVLVFHNDTAWPHPMHLHGHAFQILTRNGAPDPHRPWTDTILLAPRETAEVAFTADNPGDWLLHCHILEHHEAGMACVVRVE